MLPLQASLTRGKLAMRAGFLVDRYVGRDRNQDVPASLRLPPGEVLGRDAAVERFPALAGMPLEGVAVWHDYVTTDADRLTLAWGLAAAAHGAVLANYVEATALTIEGGRATGVTATDAVGNHRVDIRARVVVNATGASIDRLLAPAAIATGLPMLKAMNFVTRLNALPARAGRPGTLRPESLHGAVERPRALRHLGIGPSLRSRRSPPAQRATSTRSSRM